MRPYAKATTRPLSVFAFDPSLGRAMGSRMTLSVPYEDLRLGPIGRKLAVVDYDTSNDTWYEPVDLDERHVLLRNGLDPSEADPRFHQQMVYAVASETIRRFEFALGREVKWRHRRDGTRSRLRIFPHAFQQANAFFDAGLNALLFGYFAAGQENVGSALPGQTVFTCLSHDIVAHETTHSTAMRFARRVLTATPLAGLIAREMLPGQAAQSDDDLARYAKRMVKTNYHPVGTARMGPPNDAMAVLDEHLRVRGVEALRVIDCAAVPRD